MCVCVCHVPMALGRCGVRVENRPTFCPSLGGFTWIGMWRSLQHPHIHTHTHAHHHNIHNTQHTQTHAHLHTIHTQSHICIHCNTQHTHMQSRKHTYKACADTPCSLLHLNSDYSAAWTVLFFSHSIQCSCCCACVCGCECASTGVECALYACVYEHMCVYCMYVGM